MERQIEQTLTSLEVAEMVEKEHKRLLKDIRRYTEQLVEGNIAPYYYWTEDTYSREDGRKYPCYLITKKGCELIAHKMTGTKGTIFTAKYIDRFHEMEEIIVSGNSSEITELKNVLLQFEQKLEYMCNQILEAKYNDKAPYYVIEKNPYGIAGTKKLKALNEKINIAAEKYDLDRNKMLHYTYKELEERMDISLDGLLKAYKFNTGDTSACVLHVIASNQELYDETNDMLDTIIKRKEIFG